MILKTLMILLLMCSVTQAESIYYFTDPPRCPPCREFADKVLSNKEVQGLMRKFDATFKIQTTRHPNITKFYKIQSIPTLLIVKRAETYADQGGIIVRSSTVKGIAVWPQPGVSLTNRDAFINFLKIHLKGQEESQSEDTPDVIRKF